MKGKYYVIISDAERAFDKIWHSSMRQTLNKLGIQGTYINVLNVNIVEVIYGIPIAKPSYSAVENWKGFFKIRYKTRMHTLKTPVEHITGNPSGAIRQEKEIRDIQLEREK